MSERLRFCIFCGGPPNEKNREHVLPQWLIELTGPPKRVVNFGVNILTGKQPRFDWSSFVFPACTACNQRYASLEGRVKKVVERLLEGAPVSGYGYVELLNWLDKVRVGLWLGYYYLHKNLTRITPNFHIESRIGQKDRMVAVYTIGTDKKGLNAVGAETPLFQINPSCFSLNINCIHILNMSWDYMCALRCGFPFPRQMEIDLDRGGVMECSDYITTHRIKHPVIKRSIIKPALHIYQPVLRTPLSAGNFAQDEWIKNMLIPGSERQGVLIRQYDSRIEVIKDQSSLIEYNEVTGRHCKPLKDIIAQTYDLQLWSSLGVQYKSSDPEKLAGVKEMRSTFKKVNISYRDAFKNLKKNGTA